eukprot:scaffold442606_cov19-Prasinocladus_malaysianus.AAC.1
MSNIRQLIAVEIIIALGVINLVDIYHAPAGIDRIFHQFFLSPARRHNSGGGGGQSGLTNKLLGRDMRAATNLSNCTASSGITQQAGIR